MGLRNDETREYTSGMIVDMEKKDSQNQEKRLKG